jgi:hypothetical protein
MHSIDAAPTAPTPPTMTTGRDPRHARNDDLESLLGELTSLLSPVDALAAVDGDRPRDPVVLVVGLPRSGSTVTMQFLAATGVFTYPTNLLSRFHGAPAVGARIQALLTDPRYDFKGELSDVGSPISFTSDLGKSAGALQPNEFWYFWRRYFPLTEPRRLDDHELASVDRAGFLRGLRAIEQWGPGPLALKGMLVQLNLPYLTELFERVVYVDVARAPFFQCQSILEARRRFFGDDRGWYSVKPPEYTELQTLDPHHQVAGQVHHLRRHLDAGLDHAGPDRVVRMSYDQFCNEPARLYQEVRDRLARQGCSIPANYPGPDRFQSRDQVRLDDRDRDGLIDAYAAMSGTDITPETTPCT